MEKIDVASYRFNQKLTPDDGIDKDAVHYKDAVRFGIVKLVWWRMNSSKERHVCVGNNI